MEFVNGKWNCWDCNKEMKEVQYVGLDCCSECYHQRIWGKEEQEESE